jgi:hypothetical protein
VLGVLFAEQLAVIQDPHPWKSLLCPRRAGKSFALIAYALYVALTIPGASVLMCTLTLKNTKKLFWDDIEAMGKLYGLGFERPGYSHKTDGWFKLENGSIIRMAGAETMLDCERLRGPDYDLALVDESASFNNEVFRYLIDEVIIPGTGACDGTMVIAGTPGDIMAGAFFEATYPKHKDKETQQPTTRSFAEPDEFWTQELDIEPEWSRHHWSQEQNVAKPGLWANTMRRKKAKRMADDNPIWLQEYLGKCTTACKHGLDLASVLAKIIYAKH